MQCDEASNKALEAASKWYERHRNSKGNINTNVMTSGMAVAELLRGSFPLAEEDIRSEKDSQVRGLSGAFVKKVLARHGENRKFTSEGGRTSRRTLAIATDFANVLNNDLSPFDMDEACRNRVADELQQFFVECVRKDFFDKKTIEVMLDSEKPISHVICDILDEARKRADQPTGIVAQHLVGAKLELRYPNLEIGRDRANAADQQTERQGDFQLGNTAFHVTVAPSAKLADRARENLRNGFRPIVLVDRGHVAFASGLFDSEGIGERVGVYGIEDFVGTNVEEMGSFDSETIRTQLARLIRRYNERIEACETDQSLRIEEPEWMRSLSASEYAIVSL